MAYFNDQTSYQINLSGTPKRIVSLVPSQTELLYTLGLEDEVIGITKFCIHPNEWFKTKERVGGTKKLDIEKILSLQPDLILGNKEENTKEDIEALRKHAPVWLSDIYSFDDAIDMIDQVGIMTNTITKAQMLIHSIFIAQNELVPTAPKRVAYLIWNEPLVLAGKNTFIDAMMTAAGFENILTTKRYPTLTDAQLKKLNPQYIFLSSEPFPFTEKHSDDFQERFPDATIVLVDGELFSWYGSRLLKSFDYYRVLNESLG